MANPSALPADMVLYCAAEPDGRLFQKGEPWPGDAWSMKKGGEPAGSNAAAGALKDLIEANDRLDKKDEQLARKDHDLALMAAQRDEANGKVAGLEQRAIAAEKAQAAAEEAARGYMQERDAARADLKDAQDKLAGVEEASAADKATIERLAGELEAANQLLADASTAAASKPAKKSADPAPEAAPEPAQADQAA